MNFYVYVCFDVNCVPYVNSDFICFAIFSFFRATVTTDKNLTYTSPDRILAQLFDAIHYFSDQSCRCRDGKRVNLRVTKSYSFSTFWRHYRDGKKMNLRATGSSDSTSLLFLGPNASSSSSLSSSSSSTCCVKNHKINNKSGGIGKQMSSLIIWLIFLKVSYQI